MRAVGIDPGGTTGLCYTINGLDLKFQVLTGQHHLELHDFLVMFNPDTICLESFHWQPRYHELISCEYIGVVKMWHQQRDEVGHRLVTRKPADAKAFINDAKLKRAGYWKGLSTHERDAARHLLAHFCLDQKNEHWIHVLRAPEIA